MTDQTLDLRGQNTLLRNELASAIRERDEWHRLAVESDREVQHHNYHGVNGLAYCERCKIDQARTHDGIPLDKAIHPRSQA